MRQNWEIQFNFNFLKDVAPAFPGALLLQETRSILEIQLKF